MLSDSRAVSSVCSGGNISMGNDCMFYGKHTVDRQTGFGQAPEGQFPWDYQLSFFAVLESGR